MQKFVYRSLLVMGLFWFAPTVQAGWFPSLTIDAAKIRQDISAANRYLYENVTQPLKQRLEAVAEVEIQVGYALIDGVYVRIIIRRK